MTAHILNHVIRTLLMYFTVFASMRIMGKREIGELSIFDLVISIMIAEIGVFVIDDLSRPLYEGFIPIIVLVVVQISLSQLSLYSRKLRVFVDGKPSVIIKHGEINQHEMKKQRYNLDDLLMQLRSQNIGSINDVEFAVLETSGQLSVLPKPDKKPGKNFKKTNGNRYLLSKIKYSALPIPLIMDGVVQDENLEDIGQTRFWLKQQLQSKGVLDFKEVFFCTLDYKGDIYVNLKDPKL